MKSFQDIVSSVPLTDVRRRTKQAFNLFKYMNEQILPRGMYPHGCIVDFDILEFLPEKHRKDFKAYLTVNTKERPVRSESAKTLPNDNERMEHSSECNEAVTQKPAYHSGTKRTRCENLPAGNRESDNNLIIELTDEISNLSKEVKRLRTMILKYRSVLGEVTESE